MNSIELLQHQFCKEWMQVDFPYHECEQISIWNSSGGRGQKTMGPEPSVTPHKGRSLVLGELGQILDPEFPF